MGSHIQAQEFISKIIRQATAAPKKIVFPEATELRILEAAKVIIEKNIAKIILLGNVEEVTAACSKIGLSPETVTIIEPDTSPQFESYVNTFFELRKHKAITRGEASEVVKKPIYYGTLMVHCGDADGLVSGAVHSTGETIKPALQIIKTSADVSKVSSVFFMSFTDRVLVFADCAIVEYPTPQELAEIAVQSAETALLFGFEPKVAMLSYSTKGSADSISPKKVIEATNKAREILHKKYGALSKIEIDGELQVDAALVASVGKLKAPDSPVCGRANVLIFPNLDAGNMAYKLVERLAHAHAYGPILQGLAKPVNDLSRGCNSDDIVGITAITVVQAQGLQHI
ncbi:MAG: phosphate acetyltransferase [Candidatus Omnitrophica bacterium]|nr:phosphate acetyltransferase [Candidatus Omnitrophota bacterium]